MSEEIRVAMSLNTGPFQKGLTKSKVMAKQFAGGLNQTLGTFGLQAVSIAGLLAMINSTRDLIKELKWLEAQTGINAEELQALQFAASRSGAETDHMTGALEEFSNRIGEASEGAATMKERFDRYGISLRDSNYHLKSTRVLLDEVANVIQKTGDASQRAFIADEFFGGDGAKLVGLLSQGADGMKKMTDEARMLGVVIENDASAAIMELGKNIDGFAKGTLTGFLNALGKGVKLMGQYYQFLGGVWATGDFKEALAIVKQINEERDQEETRQRNVGGGRHAKEREKLIQANKAIAASQIKLLLLQSTETENLKRIKDEHATIAKQIEDRVYQETQHLAGNREKALEMLRKQGEFRDLEKQALEKQIVLETRRNALISKRNSLEERMNNARQSLETAKGDRAKFTLAELANYNVNGFAQGNVREDAIKARRVTQLLQQAESARFNFGDIERSKELFAQADKLRNEISSLRTNERNPFGAMEQGLDGMKTELADLNKMASEAGIRIKIPVVDAN